MQLKDIHTIYFLGIGGIGMSALARFFKKHGARVAGYDRTASALTRALEAEGMEVHYVDDPSLVPEQPDLVVWTPAIPADHLELNFIREKGFLLKKRAEVLGIISESKRCVAIAGTHGKTTTSSICAHLLRDGGIDATAFLGGIALNFNNNFVEGDSEWIVTEADEYDRSFLHLHPEIAILNSMDPDHLDIYGTPEEVVRTYKQFVGQIKPGGALLYKHGLPLDDALDNLQLDGRYACSFGIDNGDIFATNLRIESGKMLFDLSTAANWHGPKLNALTMEMQFPGRHNVENATAACAAALLTGIGPQKVKEALASFKGVHRRFEYVLRTPECVYIDDYAHHPAELAATIQAARSLFPEKRLTGVFQPHLYSRTRDFAAAFAAALDLLDACYLLPIYPAREQAIPGVISEMLLDKMHLADKQLCYKAELLQRLEANPPELLLTMGAGDIDTMVAPIHQLLNPHQ